MQSQFTETELRMLFDNLSKESIIKAVKAIMYKVFDRIHLISAVFRLYSNNTDLRNMMFLVKSTEELQQYYDVIVNQEFTNDSINNLTTLMYINKKYVVPEMVEQLLNMPANQTYEMYNVSWLMKELGHDIVAIDNDTIMNSLYTYSNQPML